MALRIGYLLCQTALMTVRPRPYKQVARARSTEQTREALLDAADKELASDGFAGTSLEAVASRAGVSKQTALRHFGSKEGLIDALLRRTTAIIGRDREVPPGGDVRIAVKALMNHYETWGEGVLCMLGAEAHVPIMRRVTNRGRNLHRDWVTRTFAPQLERLGPESRERRIAQLMALCDVYMWKLLRRDMGLSLPEVEASLVEMIERILDDPAPADRQIASPAADRQITAPASTG